MNPLLKWGLVWIVGVTLVILTTTAGLAAGLPPTLCLTWDIVGSFGVGFYVGVQLALEE